MKNWMQLKSGTDIRGVAVAENEGAVELTEKATETIGKSYISWLSSQQDKPKRRLEVGVGMDSRITGEKLKKALLTGLAACGASVYDCGLASTPAMFMSTVLADYEYDGAIMITASHLPYNRNGFKFFTSEGGLEEEDIESILTIADQKDFSLTEEQGTIKEIDLISGYAQYLVNKIRSEVKGDQSEPLAGFNIVVDAGNGAGGFFTEEILEPLGADTSGSQFLQPDGYFPNHVPNPENEAAMEAIRKTVVDNKADLGIIFDTDVDRAAVVDSEGQIINKNKLIALASAIVLEDYPGAMIVTDSVTSKGLQQFIEEKLGGHHHRFKRGYKNVINEAVRLNKAGKEASLAIETSGHAAFKENYFLDDGAYLIAKILIKMANLQLEAGASISNLIADLHEAEITEEYRMTIQRDDFQAYGEQILNTLKDYVQEIEDWEVAPKNYQGIRVNCGGKDWFLLRLSLHDPVLVLNMESENEENFVAVKEKLITFLQKFKDVDSTLLT